MRGGVLICILGALVAAVVANAATQSDEIVVPYAVDAQEGFCSDDPDTISFTKVVRNLIAGQTINVGKVTVTYENGQFKFVYQVRDPWVITEIHAGVYGDCDLIPRRNGGVQIGRLPINKTIGTPRKYVVGKQPLSTVPRSDDAPEEDICCGDKLCFIAHAVVVNTVNGREETAYGAGTDLGTANWATIFRGQLECNDFHCTDTKSGNQRDEGCETGPRLCAAFGPDGKGLNNGSGTGGDVCKKCINDDLDNAYQDPDTGCPAKRPICVANKYKFGNVCVVCKNNQPGADPADAGCPDDKPYCVNCDSSVEGCLGGRICAPCPDGTDACLCTKTPAECGGDLWTVDDSCNCQCPVGTLCPTDPPLRVIKKDGDCVCGCLDNKTGDETDYGCSAGEPLCAVVIDGVGVNTGGNKKALECKTCINDKDGGATDTGCEAGTPLCAAGDDKFGDECKRCVNDKGINGTDSGCTNNAPFCIPCADGDAGCVGGLTCAECPDGSDKPDPADCGDGGEWAIDRSCMCTCPTNEACSSSSDPTSSAKVVFEVDDDGNELCRCACETAADCEGVAPICTNAGICFDCACTCIKASSVDSGSCQPASPLDGSGGMASSDISFCFPNANEVNCNPSFPSDEFAIFEDGVRNESKTSTGCGNQCGGEEKGLIGASCPGGNIQETCP